MAAADLQISENSFLVKYFDMVNAKLHLVWGHFQHGNPAMPFAQLQNQIYGFNIEWCSFQKRSFSTKIKFGVT